MIANLVAPTWIKLVGIHSISIKNHTGVNSFEAADNSA